MLPLWKGIDRFELKSAVVALCNQAPAGLLIVVADDEGERGVAADLAESLLIDYGYDTKRIREAGTRAATLRQMLGSAWRRVDPAMDPTTVHRSVGEGRYMEPGALVDEIAACCDATTGNHAFVFDTVDRDERMQRSVMSQFARLAQRSACPVVVFCRKESESEIPRHATVFRMGDMEVWEVKVSLGSAPALATLAEADMSSLLDAVDAVANGGSVLPYDAYSVVEDALRKIAT